MLEITLKAESLNELHEKILTMASELGQKVTPKPSKSTAAPSMPPSLKLQTETPTGEEPAETDAEPPVEDLLPKLQELARELVGKGLSANIKSILTSAGASKLSDVPSDKQATVLAAMEAL